MKDRSFDTSWAWQAPNGVTLRFRRNVIYKVPNECAEYADEHGISNGAAKAIKAAEENKALAGAPENK